MRVLVVDDNQDFLLLATKALEAAGHVVDVQASAFGLVNRVAGASGAAPDVVMLDCDLPGLTGPAALDLLARDRRTQLVPVVLVSAADSPAHRAAAATHPRALFVHKDGRMRSLADAVVAHARAHAPQDVSVTRRG